MNGGPFKPRRRWMGIHLRLDPDEPGFIIGGIHCRLLHRTSTQMRCRTVAVHRRWYPSLWAPTTLAVESPTDLFVASHWLEWSCGRFTVTLLVFNRAHHSSLQVLTTTHVVYLNFLLKPCFKKPPSSSEERRREAFILCKINKAEWMTKYNSYSAKGYR